MAQIKDRMRKYEAVAHIPISRCPFCGQDARLTLTADQWGVECIEIVDCGASGGYRDTPEAAAEAWNRRPL